MKENIVNRSFQTVGIDVGDHKSVFKVLDEKGVGIEEGQFPTTPEGLHGKFAKRPSARIALEVGTHSRWIARSLRQWSHEVFLANPRKFRLIGENDNKDDRTDADLLARVARFDPKLLYPVWQRDDRKQAHLTLLRARGCLVKTRTALINYVRGTLKSFAGRVPGCEAERFTQVVIPHIPQELRHALEPLVESIAQLSQQISIFDQRLKTLAKIHYPQTRLLEEVQGVGPITSLTFLLTVGDPHRFSRTRRVGSYLGLRPRKQDSSQSSPQLSITKAGDGVLRSHLVQCAQQILRRNGPDSALRRHGLKIARIGGKNAKKRAVIAVARKLSLVLLSIWKTGALYQPFPNRQKNPA